jgi:hypothetical protein
MRNHVHRNHCLISENLLGETAFQREYPYAPALLSSLDQVECFTTPDLPQPPVHGPWGRAAFSAAVRRGFFTPFPAAPPLALAALGCVRPPSSLPCLTASAFELQGEGTIYFGKMQTARTASSKSSIQNRCILLRVILEMTPLLTVAAPLRCPFCLHHLQVKRDLGFL